jgi:hypothetical protein
MTTAQEIKKASESFDTTYKEGLFQLYPGPMLTHVESGKTFKALIVDIGSDSVFLKEMCKWLPAREFEIPK